ncbi:MAG: hypothetical protein LCH61_15720 [Proteobacteria bacterium]|nr:hypothetical protein [Pseudomonadota bacterium]
MRFALALAGLLLASPAFACSCMRPGPDTPKPQHLLLATVTDVATSSDGASAVTTLKVIRNLIGRAEGTIRVRARTSSAGCGVRFRKGARQLFALQRQGSGYTTNLCLMLQAQQ